MSQVGIGTIKLFDPKNKRGVITPQEIKAKQSASGDLYFEAGDADAAQLRVGQLVQFVVDTTASGAPRAIDVAVLSQQA